MAWSTMMLMVLFVLGVKMVTVGGEETVAVVETNKPGYTPEFMAIIRAPHATHNLTSAINLLDELNMLSVYEARPCNETYEANMMRWFIEECVNARHPQLAKRSISQMPESFSSMMRKRFDFVQEHDRQMLKQEASDAQLVIRRCCECQHTRSSYCPCQENTLRLNFSNLCNPTQIRRREQDFNKDSNGPVPSMTSSVN